MVMGEEGGGIWLGGGGRRDMVRGRGGIFHVRKMDPVAFL